MSIHAFFTTQAWSLLEVFMTGDVSNYYDKIFKALIAAKKEFKELVRSKKAYNYMYAPMENCIESTEPALLKNGLAVIQNVVNENEKIGIQTLLVHESGQLIENEFFWNLTKRDPQSLGSAITYFRRYSYMAILGLAPEDDDGETHKETYNNNGPKAIKPTDKQKKMYAALLNQKYNGVIPDDVINTAKDMSLGDMSQAIDTLKKELE